MVVRVLEETSNRIKRREVTAGKRGEWRLWGGVSEVFSDLMIGGEGRRVGHRLFGRECYGFNCIPPKKIS